MKIHQSSVRDSFKTLEQRQFKTLEQRQFRELLEIVFNEKCGYVRLRKMRYALMFALQCEKLLWISLAHTFPYFT